MDYFELFDIPVQLKVNAGLLSKRFFELSKKYHPDYFANESDEVQAEALEKSALLNKAWKTFQNPDATIKYVLQEKGLLEEEEKYELPPDFLMEVLEINEQLMDAGEPGAGSRESGVGSQESGVGSQESGVGSHESGVENIQSAIDNLQSEIYEPVKKIIESYKDDTTTEKELLQVKEYYYKKKYIDRIRRQMAGMA